MRVPLGIALLATSVTALVATAWSVDAPSGGHALTGRPVAPLHSRPAPAPTATRPAPGALLPAKPAPSPSPAAGAARTPAQHGSAGGASYSLAFPLTASGAVRWNPCQPIHYVTNLGAAPGLSEADVVATVAIMSHASGLTFVWDGPTTELPSTTRQLVQPARYGDRFAPLLVAVVPRRQTDLLPPLPAIGYGLAVWMSAGGSPREIVTGELAIDASSEAALDPGWSTSSSFGPTLLHELGHTLGLGHTTAAGEIMNPDPRGRGTSFGPSDLAGLQAVGATNGCQPVITAPLPPIPTPLGATGP